MQDVYAETVSVINFNNGVVRMMLVDQDPSVLAENGNDPEKMKPRMKQQIIMPLPGFLYMISVIKGLMEDPKMQQVIEKYSELGLLPQAGTDEKADNPENDDAAAA